MSDFKLGDKVIVTKNAVGCRLTYRPNYEGPSEIVKVCDPEREHAFVSGAVTDRHREAGRPLGVFRYVHVRDLKEPIKGFVVGKTFRYEGRIQYEEGFMLGVFDFKGGYGVPERIVCWEVKEALNRKPFLVPVDGLVLA